MILHTTVPLEIVLEGWDREREASLVIERQGIRMEVESVSPGIGRIVRLLDCSLYDYLEPSLMPGSLIMLEQQDL
ncbi:YlzJ-like family protein [Paenibacillus sp. 1P07SE]|uniref:YlzJ-like family protein n=1 Tax=Paenibacillus sp. 1P07SE TaxID=3132209 RepID=UPI0039A63F5A